MKNFRRILFLICILSFQAVAGVNGGGNGGGGVQREGRYMTFYSAGFYTEEEEQKSKEIPQLFELMDFVQKSPLSISKKAILTRVIMPSNSRKYFSVKKDFFTDETRKRLISEYSRATQAKLDELSIFAVTDIHSRTTYLLPGFFKLSPVEQQAILYHEAIWILFPSYSYEKIIDMEMRFQALLEGPTLDKNILEWALDLKDHSTSLRYILKHDLKKGNLSGLVQSGRYIRLSDLLGKAFFECRMSQQSNCYSLIEYNLLTLSRSYPNSLFLKVLINQIEKEKEVRGTVSVETSTRRGSGSGSPLGEVWMGSQNLLFFALNSFIDLSPDRELYGGIFSNRKKELRFKAFLPKKTRGKPRGIKHYGFSLVLSEVSL